MSEHIQHITATLKARIDEANKDPSFVNPVVPDKDPLRIPSAFPEQRKGITGGTAWQIYHDAGASDSTGVIAMFYNPQKDVYVVVGKDGLKKVTSPKEALDYVVESIDHIPSTRHVYRDTSN